MFYSKQEIDEEGTETQQPWNADDEIPPKHFAWLYSESAKIAARTFLNLMLFLAILAVIGCSIYVSILTFPAIAAALSAALVLSSVSPGILTLIALLPLLASIAVLLRFLKIQWELSTLGCSPHYSSVGELIRDIGYQMLRMFRVLIYRPVDQYALELFLRAFVIGYNPPKNGSEMNTPSGYRIQKMIDSWNLYGALIAIGLGLFLTVKIMPTLLAAVVALGVPFPVAVLFGAAAAATLIVINYQLLALPLTLYTTMKSPAPHEGEKLLAGLTITGVIVGMGLAIALSTVFYPVLVSTLSALLTPSMAGFTAVALCVAFTLAIVYLLANVGKFIAGPGESLGISKSEGMREFGMGTGPRDSITDSPTNSKMIRDFGGQGGYRKQNKEKNDNDNHSHSYDSEPDISLP